MILQWKPFRHQIQTGSQLISRSLHPHTHLIRGLLRAFLRNMVISLRSQATTKIRRWDEFSWSQSERDSMRNLLRIWSCLMENWTFKRSMVWKWIFLKLWRIRADFVASCLPAQKRQTNITLNNTTSSVKTRCAMATVKDFHLKKYFWSTRPHKRNAYTAKSCFVRMIWRKRTWNMNTISIPTVIHRWKRKQVSLQSKKKVHPCHCEFHVSFALGSSF